MRFHLRSRSGDEIVLYLRPGNPSAPIEMAGPANLCGTVSTLLKMSLTGLSATSDDLLSLCEYDPVFRHWFRLDAVVKDGDPEPAHREDAKFAAMEPIYPSQVAAMRLGERLIAASLVTKEQLDEALKGIQEQMPHLSNWRNSLWARLPQSQDDGVFPRPDHQDEHGLFDPAAR